ncbi:unnamed protein product, partial [Medioppia subpectinata]
MTVTGSNSGIGESTVLLFSELGAKVVVTGRDADKNQVVANKCQQISPNNYKPLTVVADLSKEHDGNKLMDAVIEHYGQLDVLVNNAGKGGGRPDETLQELDQYYNINLRSVYQLCLKAKPLLEKTKGSIVNISSINGLKPFPNVSYCLSKAGLDMLTRCLAMNWGPIGIRVNGLNPGQVDTPIWHESTTMTSQQIHDMWKAVDMKYPVRRRGYPEDIAKAIAFLASKDSGFITVVLVTGSSSGIGETTALLFAKLGAKVVVTGRDANRVDDVANQCYQISPNKFTVLKFVGDLGEDESVDALMDLIVKTYNQLDVVVNNAGRGIDRNETLMKSFDDLHRVNLRSIYRICLKAQPLLEISKGVVINNSSICGLKPFPEMLAYCTSKA